MLFVEDVRAAALFSQLLLLLFLCTFPAMHFTRKTKGRIPSGHTLSFKDGSTPLRWHLGRAYSWNQTPFQLQNCRPGENRKTERNRVFFSNFTQQLSLQSASVVVYLESFSLASKHISCCSLTHTDGAKPACTSALIQQTDASGRIAGQH